MKTLKSLRNLKGKRVLLRVDFNVPVKRGRVMDETKIRASLPTIVWLLRKKAKVVLLSHLGRPKGKRVAAMKMDPVIRCVSKLLGRTVEKIDTGNWKMSKRKWTAVQERIAAMHDGDIMMAENTRFAKDEKKNTGALAEHMASLGDLFVFDGFAVAHRPAASIAGIPAFLPSYAGPLLEKEMKGLEKVFKGKSPFVVVLGGAKVETKIPVLDNLLPRADAILIGGAIFNTCLKAQGYEIQDSLIDAAFTKEALTYCKKKKIVTPRDVIVGSKDGRHHRVVQIKRKAHEVCKRGEAIYDIGPETIRLYATHIKQAQTVVWNGAMGYFEQKPYDVGTLSIARLVASRAKGKAYGVAGGGETIQALDMVKMAEHVDLISTGGGAMLEFLAGKTLPAIAALNKKKI